MKQFESEECKIKDKVLLLEGKNDCHVVKHILRKHEINIQESFALFDCGNHEDVLKNLPAKIKEEGLLNTLKL